MCPLNLFSKKSLSFALIVFSPHVYAQIGTAQLQYDHQTAIQLNELSIPLSSKTISLEIPTLIDSIGLSIGISQLTQDLTNRNLTFKNDTLIPLASVDSGERTSARVSLNYTIGSHAFTVSSQQDIKPSLFTAKKLTLGYILQMNQGATLLKFSFANSEENQPLSFYIDPGSLQSKERPTVVKNLIYTTALQQIWTDQLKTQTTLSLKDSKNFRPYEIQIKIASAFSLSDKWTLRNEIASASENKNQNLDYDRGYFESRWADIELNYEWTLDSFLITGFSFLDEVESDPRRNLKTALGTDEIALGLKQIFSNFNYNLKTAYTLNSEEQTSTSFSGGLGWTF